VFLREWIWNGSEWVITWYDTIGTTSAYGVLDVTYQNPIYAGSYVAIATVDGQGDTNAVSYTSVSC
jgi:hypothetical protein